MGPEATVAARFAAIRPHLNERQRRLWVGAEARVLGRGGVSLVARATGVSRPTVYKALAELDQPPTADGRVRRPGGGRKSLRERDPELEAALDALVDPDTRGDPMSPLRWTCKSTGQLALALTRGGHPVSADTVGDLLHAAGYRLQANVKTREGAQHPDRDAQFRYLNEQVRAFRDAGLPVHGAATQPTSYSQLTRLFLRMPLARWTTRGAVRPGPCRVGAVHRGATVHASGTCDRPIVNGQSAVPYHTSRCKVCRTPIRGIGSVPSRLRGIRPYSKNPQLCNRCSLESFPAEEREITVLFADARGFTTVAERSSPSEIRASLNRLFVAASAILLRHDALIDKFLGDAVMALFNAPIPQARHREASLLAAKALLEEVERLGLPFAIGVGINTGNAITGNVGGGEVTDYTAMGDTVNVASRLSGLAGGREILAAASTCEGSLAVLRPGYAASPERLEVKGRSEPVDAYRIAPAPMEASVGA